jgi:hypothetical protein
MEKMTYYDSINKVYKIKPEIIGRSIIQELGVYEDIHAADIEKAKDITELAETYIEKGVELNPYWTRGGREAGS